MPTTHEATEFRLYVELMKRTEATLERLNDEYTSYEQQMLSSKEIEIRAEIRQYIDSAEKDYKHIQSKLDELDDSSEYLYHESQIGTKLNVSKVDGLVIDIFIIEEVHTKHGLTQLLITLED